jgi:HD superfamily phosphodiesterase
MTSLETLTRKIRDLYEAKNPARDSWADWLYGTHLFVVADYAKKYAVRYAANVEVSVAASLLHDCADAVMSRTDARHSDMSNNIAEQLLLESGFSDADITQIVRDILPKHSCRDGVVPESLEGKVMATPDAVAHLATDFYPGATAKFRAEGRNMAAHKLWMLEKIKRDFEVKIFFDGVREEVRTRHEELQGIAAAM